MLVQLCYASTRKEHLTDLIQDLNDILVVARGFNASNKIFGVLYYANNYYFQCLEGEKSTIDSLFNQIKKDPRHHEVVHLSTMEIEQLHFKKWSMKYVQKSSPIDQFFKDLKYEKFQPKALNYSALSDFIDLLVSENSTRIGRKVGLKYRGVTSCL